MSLQSQVPTLQQIALLLNSKCVTRMSWQLSSSTDFIFQHIVWSTVGMPLLEVSIQHRFWVRLWTWVPSPEHA